MGRSGTIRGPLRAPRVASRRLDRVLVRSNAIWSELGVPTANRPVTEAFLNLFEPCSSSGLCSFGHILTLICTINRALGWSHASTGYWILKHVYRPPITRLTRPALIRRFNALCAVRHSLQFRAFAARRTSSYALPGCTHLPGTIGTAGPRERSARYRLIQPGKPTGSSGRGRLSGIQSWLEVYGQLQYMTTSR